MITFSTVVKIVKIVKLLFCWVTISKKMYAHTRTSAREKRIWMRVGGPSVIGWTGAFGQNQNWVCESREKHNVLNDTERERKRERKRSVRGINYLKPIFSYIVILSTLFMETYSILARLYSPLHILNSGIRQNAELHFHIAHTLVVITSSVCVHVCMCAKNEWRWKEWAKIKRWTEFRVEDEQGVCMCEKQTIYKSNARPIQSRYQKKN